MSFMIPNDDLDDTQTRARHLGPGDVINQRYRLMETSGAGGMGIVWKAFDQQADEVVALKVLPEKLQQRSGELDRFRRTFQLVRKLHHEHIAPLYDLAHFQHPEFGWFQVMRFIRGRTLTDYREAYVATHGAFPLSEVVRLLTPVAAAMDYAHSQQIVHRDVKLDNVLLEYDLPEETPTPESDLSIRRVWLIDFGIAAEIRATMIAGAETDTLDTAATRPYMAPELFQARQPSSFSDQYALGVMAYRLLTGYPPFDGDDFAVVRHAVIHDEVEPIDSLSDSVNAIIQKALHKDRKQRFVTCAEFIAALAAETTSVCATAESETPVETETFQNADEPVSALPVPESSSPEMEPDRVPETSDIVSDVDAPELSATLTDWQAAEDAVCESALQFKRVEGELLAVQQERVELLKSYVPTSQTVRQQDGKIAEVTSRLEQQRRVMVERLTSRDKADENVCLAMDAQVRALEAEVARLTDPHGIGYRREHRAVQQVLEQITGIRETQQPHQPGRERTAGSQPRIIVHDYLDAPENWMRNRTSPFGTELIAIRPGEFQMGSPDSEGGGNDERPQHRVRITRPFWIGQCPVTIGQVLAWLNSSGVAFDDTWIALNDGNCPIFREGSRFRLKGGNCAFGQSEDQPMVCISWHGSVAYCEWATRQEAGFCYRLPTEAEWEYCCRAGTTTPYWWGTALNGTQANCDGNNPWGTSEKGPYLQHTSEVGSYQANPWGLYDTSGNVWEWCQDWYAADWYGKSPTDDPLGPSSGSSRVCRGGSWCNNASYCRSAYRFSNDPLNRSYSIGFRVLSELRG